MEQVIKQRKKNKSLYIRRRPKNDDETVFYNNIQPEKNIQNEKDIQPEKKNVNPNPRIPKMENKRIGFSKPSKIEKIKTLNKMHEYNANGLDLAYSNHDARGLYYDQNTKTLFIAGTKFDTPQDLWDDFKIPLHMTNKADRYITADKFIKQHPEIKNLVGHSLGAATSNELNTQYKGRFNVTTYGAPNFALNLFSSEKHKNEFRHPGDPISIFDYKATNFGNLSLNPLAAHDYHNYQIPIDDKTNNDDKDIGTVDDELKTNIEPFTVEDASAANQS